ncbi:MAG: hypothetical protein ACON4W_08750 [Parvibaculales bacterium]
MEILLKIIIGAGAVALIGAWAAIVFNYPKVKDILALEATQTQGMGLIRGDVAGMLLLIGVFYALFLVYGNAWALPAIMATAAVTVGRSWSYFTDGASRENLAAIIVELVGIAAIYLLWKNLI